VVKQAVVSGAADPAHFDGRSGAISEFASQGDNVAGEFHQQEFKFMRLENPQRGDDTSKRQ